METVTLPHLPSQPLHIILFRNLANAPFLRQQLLQGCFRAINDMLQGRLKSKNVHSEIVFSLSQNNNISESFRRFGVNDSTKDVVAIKVGGGDVDAKHVEHHLLQHVEGTPVAFTDEILGEMRDEARLKKVYKIETVDGAEPYVLGSMALKGS
ncbi:hypothetical protein KC332_g11292 [Hortaea werneckii]|uniref:EKC/KEOPS complex subunit CGI121 n=1 Tax=Hortaea werneckii EXF-2000 TaxID=1157616 RepID=A0A1Z5SMA3_HORWE|nr:hypothetical protein KC358_g11417 [Hortaea werneckii]OTA21489.1 hypothetical protein BTJ68_15052 [Hortaea werneckii EXF-2000]KAI6818217.1 hypothetical protein KC350_g10373 [Hortaea werneckii]KAI6920369.1 hypothetical protein KC348_g10414 [Hortaea werneckii]KAI6931100.1 hypothetical protein KC341_g9814 [Hortaea werneckii]